MLNRALVTLLPLVPRPLVWRISRRYIAGESLDDALAVMKDLNDSGMTATLDVLGEDSVENSQAIRSRDLYIDALREIRKRGLDGNISVKLSQMGLRFNESLCRKILRELVVEADLQGSFVRIDMEDSSVTGITLDLYREMRESHSNVGAVIQAYMRCAQDDTKSLLAGGSTHLRICKGIYLESPEIAFQDREEIRDSYRQLLELLFNEGAVKVCIATHDPPLIDAALEMIENHRVEKSRYEFQMLLGVAERLRDRLVADGHPLRVYVPFGEAWYAYSTRRLRENPQIAGHVMKNLFRRR